MVILPHRRLHFRGGAAWVDINTASYDSKSASYSYLRDACGVAFKSDGTKMLVLGTNSADSDDYVFEFTLGTAWDLSTASYVDKFEVDPQAPDGLCLAVSTDGTKMYVGDGTSDTVYQYTLGAAWDLTGTSYDSKSYNPAEMVDIVAIFFSSDGTKMYLGDATETIFQYTLGTAWDVSTASYASKSLAVGAPFVGSASLAGLFIDSTGTKILVCDRFDSVGVYQFTLGTAWDISTGTYDSVSYDPSTQAPYPYHAWVGGSKLFIVNDNSYGDPAVYQYSLG